MCRKVGKPLNVVTVGSVSHVFPVENEMSMCSTGRQKTLQGGESSQTYNSGISLFAGI